ncbi:MAG TPA: glutamate racemase [Actinomycetota bacterium]|nr:glutamate racemase [Actinomycetota bacterium]
MSDTRPIGVFDSGLGGLTVARAVMEVLPNESVVYFGDTARFPYGPRPLDETRTFAVEIARYLVGREAKIVVIACNTATAAALPDVTATVDVPVIGVIEPAVRAAIKATRRCRVGMIGTDATVASGSYERVLRRLDPGGEIELVAQACPQFVEFVERGDTTSPELLRLADSYLTLLRVADIDTLILGCTHYPLLRAAIRSVVGDDVAIVSSAEETAVAVYETLRHGDALRADPSPPHHAFESSGDTARFATLLTLFSRPEFHDVRAGVRP